MRNALSLIDITPPFKLNPKCILILILSCAEEVGTQTLYTCRGGQGLTFHSATNSLQPLASEESPCQPTKRRKDNNKKRRAKGVRV